MKLFTVLISGARGFIPYTLNEQYVGYRESCRGFVVKKTTPDYGKVRN